MVERSINFKLLKAIKERGLLQRDFAQLVGDDPSTVSRIINGVWIPDRMRQLKYARTLGLGVRDIFSGQSGETK
jgi:transcriptional regulator with XRE-family HTH domain